MEELILKTLKLLQSDKFNYLNHFKFASLLLSKVNISPIDLQTAIKSLETCISLEPNFKQARKLLSKIYFEINQVEKSISCLNEIKSELSSYELNFLGVLNLISHENETAKNIFIESLKKDKLNLEAHLNLININKETATYHDLEIIKNQLKSKSLMEKSYANLCIALLYENSSNFDKAFYHFHKANEFQNQITGFKPESSKVEINTIKNIYFSVKNCTKVLNKNNSHQEVIFIIGLPRSGSTLIEQILTTNPVIESVGEAKIISKLTVNKLPLSSVNGFKSLLTSNDESLLVSLREQYFHWSNIYGAKKPIIVNKLLDNYKLLPAIFKIFPNAKIIDMRRNKKALALSLFKNLFPSGEIQYSYDLDNIKNEISLYEDLMSLWHKEYPKQIYRLNYNSLIKNPEETLRNLLNYLKLEFKDEYLDFHLNSKPIKTISFNQANQKIYQSSLKSWLNYQNHLKSIR